MPNENLYISAQKDDAKYKLLVFDLKNSKVLLKTPLGRKIFQDIQDDFRNFLINKKIIKINDSGISRLFVRKGDLIGIISEVKFSDELSKEIDEFLSNRKVFFHTGSCYFDTIDPSERKEKLFYIDAIPILEDTIKNKIVGRVNYSKETKIINVNFNIEIEDWLDKEFVETELKYAISQYGWKIKEDSL